MFQDLLTFSDCTAMQIRMSMCILGCCVMPTRWVFRPFQGCMTSRTPIWTTLIKTFVYISLNMYFNLKLFRFFWMRFFIYGSKCNRYRKLEALESYYSTICKSVVGSEREHLYLSCIGKVDTCQVRRSRNGKRGS